MSCLMPLPPPLSPLLQGSSLLVELQSLCPPHLTSGGLSVQDSGKLRVLSAILGQLHAQHHREKIVLISNYTQVHSA